MPIMGEKSPEYPLGYGYCACGCGKVTKVAGGVHLKYFHRLHNPYVSERARELARQPSLPRQIAKERELLGAGLLSDHEPAIMQPTADAVPQEQTDERLARTVAWTQINKHYIQWHRKKLRAKANETAKRYQRERRKRDPIFKLLAYVRGRIRGALTRKNVRKSTKTEQLLACSVLELKSHLEAQFKDGMTWNNYGQWHVDHIKPCCRFDLTRPEEQRACFHYTNLQPLWAHENHTKSGRPAYTVGGCATGHLQSKH
jgi:hypothetical protein